MPAESDSPGRQSDGGRAVQRSGLAGRRKRISCALRPNSPAGLCSCKNSWAQCSAAHSVPIRPQPFRLQRRRLASDQARGRCCCFSPREVGSLEMRALACGQCQPRRLWGHRAVPVAETAASAKLVGPEGPLWAWICAVEPSEFSRSWPNCPCVKPCLVPTDPLAV